MPKNQALQLIETQDWLDPVSEVLKKLVSSLYSAGGPAGQKVKDALHGTWLGHPLHPALTDIPLGAWTTAVILDGAAAVSGDTAYSRAAEGAVCIGLSGAALAAVTGLTDWQHTDGKQRRLGLVHGVINLTGVALFTTSYFLRRRRNTAGARAFALAGFAAAIAAAYLGGTLVYSEQVGVNHAVGPEPPGDYAPVLREYDLAEGGLRRVEVNGARVLILRRNGRTYAMNETCSHLGGPLSEGQIENGSVRCPWHGSRFALETGEVIEGPATYAQPCYEARIRDGQIEIRKGKQP